MEAQEPEEAKKEEEQAEKEKAKDNRKNTDGELFNGIITLNVMPPIDLNQFKNFEEAIKQIPELRLVLIGGSMDEGNEVIVSAESPIPLLSILKDLPSVAEVNKKGKSTQVTLKSE